MLKCKYQKSHKNRGTRKKNKTVLKIQYEKIYLDLF